VHTLKLIVRGRFVKKGGEDMSDRSNQAFIVRLVEEVQSKHDG
jgi:hypothetical protein